MTHDKIVLVEGTNELLEKFVKANITALEFLWEAVVINLNKHIEGWKSRRALQKRSKDFKDIVDNICNAIGDKVVGSRNGYIKQKTF